ncbi:MAG: YidC/Oxa1 family membrane protein insertase, partial [Bdellovibrionales bacterium]|nr:YidC/Oxa1 family membrane protein insertase [Bdellovibrionales bacterium]
MGVVMFIQQKLSPVTLNKEMLRAMQIMPIFMSLFMINLPSGLVLYMLVSTVFGLAQQVYLNKKGDLKISLPAPTPGGN